MLDPSTTTRKSLEGNLEALETSWRRGRARPPEKDRGLREDVTPADRIFWKIQTAVSPLQVASGHRHSSEYVGQRYHNRLEVILPTRFLEALEELRIRDQMMDS